MSKISSIVSGSDYSVRGRILDPVSSRFFRGEVRISEGRVVEVSECASAPDWVIAPGFVDSHVHIESSLLVPTQFARLALPHGTVATVSDPHEIANVCGVEGVKFMIENARKSPLKFFFGAPSCVPATTFESSGAVLGVAEVSSLLSDPDIYYLAEMMNWPGVLNGDAEVLAKIAAARRVGKPVDGHAPGLMGEDARRYAECGITTDHECFTEAEARDKLASGMKILIREGSAAKNFEALIGLLAEFPGQIMFCTDDAHPDYLRRGHINLQVQRALARGFSLLDVFAAAAVNPVNHYKLPVGLLQPGDPADFIVFEESDLKIVATVINGSLVFADGVSPSAPLEGRAINNFNRDPIRAEEIKLTSPRSESLARVIEVIPGQLITAEKRVTLPVEQGEVSLIEGIQKLVVADRYNNAPPQVAFVSGFDFKLGAIASTVAHDSHNVIAAGVDEASIVRAMNLVIKQRGGLALVGERELVLPLDVAGLMSRGDAFEVAELYEELDRAAKEELGSTLPAPFMTLSFLALLVIPDLKLSDKGLFSGKDFRFVSLFT